MEISGTDLGRALVARRQRVERTCPVCGTVFTGYAGGKKKPDYRGRVYCTPACRFKAFYRRHGGRTAHSPAPAASPAAPSSTVVDLTKPIADGEGHRVRFEPEIRVKRHPPERGDQEEMS